MTRVNANVLFTIRTTLAAVLLIAIGASAQQSAQSRSDKPYQDRHAQATPPLQPIPFSHKKHAILELQCDVCHSNPDPGDNMTIAETATCMACHETVASDTQVIKKLARFAQSNKPVPWIRVYSVPAFVYWSHRTHLQAGLKCELCHGAVEQMDVMAKVTNVTTMAGCVDCHQERNANTGCKTCHEGASAEPAPWRDY